jgi:hypothetical protein
VDGGSQKKVLKSLLNLRAKSRKDEEVGVVGLGLKEQRKRFAFLLCNKSKKN